MVLCEMVSVCVYAKKKKKSPGVHLTLSCREQSRFRHQNFSRDALLSDWERLVHGDTQKHTQAKIIRNLSHK